MSTHTTHQISSTLHALLPTYTSTAFPSNTDAPLLLPRPLTHLTASLLQRSRARVPTLRNGEEEAARVYCVAELACHRLKGRLNLPRIESRPPCSAKVYKRLYRFLDGTLGADAGNGSGGTGGAQSKRGEGNGGSAIAAPGVSTLRRHQAMNSAVTTAAAGTGTLLKKRTAEGAALSSPALHGAKKRKVTHSGADVVIGEDEVEQGQEEDDELVPMIRSLCRALDIPEATPHVYVGVRTILDSTSMSATRPIMSASKARAAHKSHGSPQEQSTMLITKDKIPALVIIVLLKVSEKINLPDNSGSATLEVEREDERSKAIGHLVQIQALNPKQARTANQDVQKLEQMAIKHGWWTWEWMSNLPTQSMPTRTQGAGGVDGEDSDLEQLDAIAGLSGPLGMGNALQVSPGGCLMQDCFDWLSERRKREFETWKVDFLKRIEARQRAHWEEDQETQDTIKLDPRQARTLTGNVFSSIRKSLFGSRVA